MPKTYRRAAARRDLVEHFVYLAENAGLEIADRFLANTQESFRALSEHPMMGSPLNSLRPELAGLRKWRVTDFKNFLIFYLPRTDGVTIVRVLHGSRDWWRLLGIESD